jgi:hypothetical protein
MVNMGTKMTNMTSFYSNMEYRIRTIQGYYFMACLATVKVIKFLKLCHEWALHLGFPLRKVYERLQ